MSVKVETEITLYELDGEEIPLEDVSVKVSSHWNARELVVLKCGEHEYTVSALDLGKALENAQNVRR